MQRVLLLAKRRDWEVLEGERAWEMGVLSPSVVVFLASLIVFVSE